MLILRVGDPHAKPNNLTEMGNLFDFVLETARLNKVDRIELLGDLFHTHAVMRLEVQEFWLKTLTKLSLEFQTVVLVGNHDLSGDYRSTFSALNVFSTINAGRLYVIDSPQIFGNVGIGPVIGYIPYIHEHERFIEYAKEISKKRATVLVCHQTIQGSKYESGFFASDGIPIGEWSKGYRHIISGHIHSAQSFGNIIYPGTARWDSVVDANVRKGIWIYEHGVDGSILRTDYFSTENVCSPISELVYTQGDSEPRIPDGRVNILLVGTSEWIKQEKEKFKGKVGIKTKITDNMVKERRKTGSNFQDFLSNLFESPKDKQKLLQLAKEMGIG